MFYGEGKYFLKSKKKYVSLQNVPVDKKNCLKFNLTNFDKIAPSSLCDRSYSISPLHGAIYIRNLETSGFGRYTHTKKDSF